MDTTYNPFEIEARWRETWEQQGTYRTPDESDEHDETFYCLDFFPYPSGEGLTVGHARNYVPSDVAARYMRMRGRAVLHPMGWDAFGLPAENEAIKRGVHPRVTTARYAANYRRQMTLMGKSIDWEREINSSDPEYYRWTQWFFLLLYQRGLAYQAETQANWCETDQTVLANEEIEDGRCWRCHNPVTVRMLKQWFFRITAYADRLLDDLKLLDWPDHIVRLQENWIGRSDGPEPSYRIHDWLISRQRYWGAPIPVVHCAACGTVPVPEEQLPVLLPNLTSFQPGGDGRSPLATVAEFVQTTCPHCGGPAVRETDTMGGFACSSWYFLRFPDPHYADFAFNPEAARRWLPVDLYVGGAEHAVAHLLYARFWTKVMFDAGLVDFVEPFPRLRSQGVLHGADGRRMAKSRPESVVNPDQVIAEHGADTFRLHILFIGPFEAPVNWSEEGLTGMFRFLRRVWDLSADNPPDPDARLDDQEAEERLVRHTHRTIQKVGSGVEAFKLNTAISELMVFVNALEEHQAAHGYTPAFGQAVEALVRLLAPFAPYITEEIWHRWGCAGSVHHAAWPGYDPALARPPATILVVQIDGKVRDRIEVPGEVSEDEAKQMALNAPGVRRVLDGVRPRNVIYVPGRLINFTTR